jgi:hypothetical protein
LLRALLSVTAHRVVVHYAGVRARHACGWNCGGDAWTHHPGAVLGWATKFRARVVASASASAATIVTVMITILMVLMMLLAAMALRMEECKV